MIFIYDLLNRLLIFRLILTRNYNLIDLIYRYENKIILKSLFLLVINEILNII